ncbi:MAG: SufD family Fe-S cluster assembly protein [Candidatus Cryptobacteroides sp.]|nr:SufD family Fe-S cluster assembly protein [Bacteroidales bacterium]MDY5459529.1 SufD family Fe-S cluster assembly protein [Candidatus Cryptobacteroides sp.]
MNREIYILGETVLPPVVRLEAGEKRSAAFLVPRGVSGSFEVVYELAGEGAELDLTGVYACCGEQKVDFRITVRHLCAGCVSHQLFKGLAEDEARVKFEGLVYVAAGAEKTEALQENHSLLLSENAFVQSSPQLEIYADDVVCSHGATVGSLDENEQFYMRSRGISLEEARRLQILSFLSPVLEGLPEKKIITIFASALG